MRPSISVTLEPGLERGVPWGRDLYTFVTSAAGHMMRTLQKPRKNRPSKRQVNHRRFLHNMIQRKFADIEAANHRLASALYFKDEQKNVSSPTSQQPETLDQSGSPQSGYLQDPDECSAHTEVDGISKTRTDVSHETELSEKKPPDSGHLWKRHPKSQRTTCTARKNNQSKERQKKETRNQLSSSSSPKSIDYHHRTELLHTERYDDESHLKSANNLSEDSQATHQDSGFIQFNQNVDTSPSFSPMSLDLCDFSIQMFTDISTCMQGQKSIAGIPESQWTDIMDLFSVGSKDLGGCTDVEAYFESICACQGDAGQEASADDVGFAAQSESFGNRSELEELHCETGEHRYQYRCHADQGLSTNHFLRDQRSSQAPKQNEDAAETQFNHFKPNQETDILQNEFPASITHHYYASGVQTYQHPQVESPCMLVNNQNLTPFEGVAQSFSVPLDNPEHRPIPTPPNEDEWLFTDILKDRKSLDCMSF